ncbi:SspB family protein [Afifella pfennigii]|uniref:SspB family protein n=1 Tax=Afifella pfennigii TaxID=209897 RepID=UPI000479B066|nr:ClpXP protease specificity-enhancing factor SspB [Afifella pfennigii]
MAADLIRYDVLTQEALRGVIRKVIAEVAQTGLPGEHHFFITFDTRHPGVRISSRLKAQYPEEMTIVLQHQFWDLSVTDTTFEVGLSFNGVPERLLVPLRAVKAFVDPHASFGLKFDVPSADNEMSAEAGPDTPLGELGPPLPSPLPPAILEPGAGEAAPSPSGKKKKAALAKEGAAGPEDAEAKEGAEVVSLDAFRKKN